MGENTTSFQQTADISQTEQFLCGKAIWNYDENRKLQISDRVNRRVFGHLLTTGGEENWSSAILDAKIYI